MSGGLDSSVAAALLKREGFDVVGVFMKFWSEDGSNSPLRLNRCCSLDAEVRARKVCKILGIPFYVFDFSKEFKERIVDYFLESLKRGITPNPCVMCNKEVKFGLLLEKALSLGFDFVASGHYAKVKKIEYGDLKKHEFKLFRAKDKEKDQSYFLWRLDQRKLSRILFPIGDFTRKEVELIAENFKLPVLGLKKSVELCFVTTGMKDFIKRHLKEKRGKIITKEGKIVGEHKGLWFYTIGQRKGLEIPGGPYWVLKKDVENNVLVVTNNVEELLQRELFFHQINLISKDSVKFPLRVDVKIRYRSDLTKATVFAFDSKTTQYKVAFEEPQRAITEGQSVVFFRGEEVVGGGVIC